MTKLAGKLGGFRQCLTNLAHFLACELPFSPPIEELSRTLQIVNISLQDAQKAVAGTRGFIQRQRSDHAFDYFYKTLIQDSKDLKEAPVLPRHQKHPKKLDAGEAMHTFQSPFNYYRYVEVLDLLDVEIDRCFVQRDLNMAADLESVIFSAAKGETVSFPSSTLSLYNKDFDFDRLRTQLNTFSNSIKTSGREIFLNVA